MLFGARGGWCCGNSHACYGKLRGAVLLWSCIIFSSYTNAPICVPAANWFLSLELCCKAIWVTFVAAFMFLPTLWLRLQSALTVVRAAVNNASCNIPGWKLKLDRLYLQLSHNNSGGSFNFRLRYLCGQPGWLCLWIGPQIGEVSEQCWWMNEHT